MAGLAVTKAQVDGGCQNMVVIIVGLIAAFALAPMSGVDVLVSCLLCGHGLDHKEDLSTSTDGGSLSSVSCIQLVGGHFDLEMNFIIQEGEGITCMVDLLDKCDVTCQAEVWSVFTAILKKSIRNLQACTEVGLVEQVLKRIDRADNMIADLLVDMLGVLASYNLTVRELKLFFSKLQGEKGRWPPHAGKLLSVLKHMPQKYGPDAFFNFPGKSAA
ncbi:lipopolysaccharide-responsive and beige-like anchor protein, partial [Antrostomus carolinensis]|uniref:lipopolysaccharide-responsive and beige-like anchor protein n=1 Tax=Antrostomus carolinensis TaxID=279965 RepID=UPI0010A9900A